MSNKTALSAAVYTELSDVEGEINGFMTYDRKVVKVGPQTDDTPKQPFQQHGCSIFALMQDLRLPLPLKVIQSQCTVASSPFQSVLQNDCRQKLTYALGSHLASDPFKVEVCLLTSNIDSDG